MDVVRWRDGDQMLRMARYTGEDLIEIGDLVWQDCKTTKSASRLVLGRHPEWSRREYEFQRQKQFAEKFVGVAMQRSPDGDPRPIYVATNGIFEFECQGRLFRPGTLMTVSHRLARSALYNQRVAEAISAHIAIGRLIVESQTTSINVQITIEFAKRGLLEQNE